MTTTPQAQAIAGIEIPSKWDVIPIHNSDRATFKACRRKWDWSSPARHNLTVRADVGGVYQPFFFGTGIHYALESYYNPGLRRDPVEAFNTWFSVVWDGGVVTDEWLDRSYDLNPQLATGMDLPMGDYDGRGKLWKVRGLREILPDVDHYEFEELRELGVAMLDNYKRYAETNDGFEVIAAEHDFSVPIWDYEHDCILKAIDTREDSPNYGKELEVHARGRQDILYAKPSGRIGIIDHKTADRVEDPINLEARLESDEQITTYLWAAQVEATYYDLPWKGEPLEEVMYQILRKAAPKPPTIVRGGLFSVDRNNESTTYELLREWMDSAGVSYIELDEKHQNYHDWLREVGDEQFFVRKMVRRNQHQLANIGKRIYLEALDMLAVMDETTGTFDVRGPRIYPNFRRDWSCLNCQFRPPCIAMEAGEDWQYLIRENYASTKDR